jgi:hypothetical protein
MGDGIHSVPLSVDVDDDEEMNAFIDATNKEWTCDHGLAYTEDCVACDVEWSKIEDDDDKEVVEGEVVEYITECDHGQELRLGYGVCSDCDKECKNNATYSQTSTWRLIEQRNHRFDSVQNLWVPVASSSNSTWSKKCKHFMVPFALEGNLTIYASAERDAPYNWKREDKDKPDVGVYLYSGWVRDEFYSTPGLNVPWAVESSWPMAHLPWPDYGVPSDPDDVVRAVAWILDLLAEGKRVETGCMGGHGRTGTILACILAAQGVKPGTAIKRVRDDYCEEALEGPKQCDLVAYVYEQHYDGTWRKSSKERKRFDKEKGVNSKGVTLTKPKGESTPATTTPAKEETTVIDTLSAGWETWKCDHGKGFTEECKPCDSVYGPTYHDLWD